MKQLEFAAVVPFPESVSKVGQSGKTLWKALKLILSAFDRGKTSKHAADKMHWSLWWKDKTKLQFTAAWNKTPEDLLVIYAAYTSVLAKRQ